MRGKCTPVGPIPDDTATAGRPHLKRGDLCRRIVNQYATLVHDEDFAELYSSVGKPAVSPSRLALVRLLQAAEFVRGRVAIHRLRMRGGWKYPLHLPLDGSGFDPSMLSEFGSGLARSDTHRRLFDAILQRF